ncbi:O-antigen ligase family protein [Bacillus badius]|uniref:Membrane protein n=1 Tax=Bacillus badius TaxID=1455 RepID=A0ABR5AVZ0_BACBA|nr:O-antigen ligase family protein [Bacillus badius]KIL76423.1 membrane protein [Bacillus badius]KIL78541.1 membrane protein [Bacillus badius]MED4715964.1 O-antigen ligase family protein [Bacillus badius]
MLNWKTFLLLLIFLVLQPVIDVMTTASLMIFNLNLTVGVIVRVLYMAIILLLMLKLAFSSRLAKKYIFYLVGLAVVIGINIAVNMNLKDPYFLFKELKFYNKVIYFPILFLGFNLLYLQLKKNRVPFMEKTTTYFLYSSLIISAVFIVSFLTGTSLSNYSHTKIGFTGWFFAGNEIGAIMAIILPITAVYAIEKTESLKTSHYWIPFILLSISMLFLGTKVGYGGIVIVLAAACISLLIIYLTKERTKKTRANMLIALLLLAALAVSTPFTPVFNNMYAHLGLLNIDLSKEKPSKEVPEDSEEEPEEVKEEPKITEEQFQNLVFSSREKYLADFKQDFADAPVLQKMFGMGFAGNYDMPEPGKEPKMIEMDFYDLFFSLGIIGFLYLIAPMLYYAVRFIIYFVTQIKETFNIPYIMYGVGFILAAGIGATAGHVFTAPAVSIYVAAIMSVLMVDSRTVDDN